MSGVVVIKWGGGLITNKEQLCTPDLESINNLANSLLKINKKIILIHGAGSFGHMKAKKARLVEGRIENHDQDQAVKDVREDMLILNNFVMKSLEKNGLTAESFPPRDWASGVGFSFTGELPVSKDITVSFGDVVDDEEKEFGILSGDDLMYRYATEIENVEKVIFAMKGVDGILKHPPGIAKYDDLIEIWSPEMNFDGEHQSEIDVTGGIGLKAKRGAMIAESGIDVWFVNGDYPERVISVIKDEPVRGTRIVSGNC